MPRRNNTLQHHPFIFSSKCKDKRRFATESEAVKAAEYQMLLKPELTLAVYKCELCGGWHLTNQNKK